MFSAVGRGTTTLTLAPPWRVWTASHCYAVRTRTHMRMATERCRACTWDLACMRDRPHGARARWEPGLTDCASEDAGRARPRGLAAQARTGG